MYELIQVSENAFYLDCPAKIGLVQTEGGLVAIDSGSDKDAGKKVLKAVQARGQTLTAICSTHSHADHIGGNHYLQEQTGCAIYAPAIERDFTEHPLLESAFLYGGFPLDALRRKFLLAQESRAALLPEGALPGGLKAIPLPGHSFNMVGYRTAEDVVYLADCLAARETLDKYGLAFLWDVAAYLDTLEQVKTMEARCFVPAHAPATEDIAPLAQYNIDATLAAGELIAGLCREPVLFEELLRGIFDHYGTTLNPQQYVLVGSTLRSYLAWLQKLGRVNAVFEDNRMLWLAK